MATEVQLKAESKSEGKENQWVDCGTYWLNMAEQGTPAWHAVRDCRVTASNFGSAVGRSKFKSPEAVADGVTGIHPIEFTEESERVMAIGRKQEPVARDWYCRNRNVPVREVGLAIPKWFPLIGASLDGEVLQYDANGKETSEGMIEIKCPEKMYKPLVEYTHKVSGGWKPPAGYHDHIWSSHYDQMQGCMAICNKKWCDYIVFCEQENCVFVHRLDFDRVYWETSLYPGLQNFVYSLLYPRLKETGKAPIFPPGASLPTPPHSAPLPKSIPVFNL